MDTGEQYIKMCEKAIEVQARKPFDRMSWYVTRCLDPDENDVIEGFNLCSVSTAVWLPRQDQLQGMVPYGLMYQVGMFNEFVVDMKGNWITGENEMFSSMEQLWLAFVMKEKYGKKWCEDKWETV